MPATTYVRVECDTEGCLSETYVSLVEVEHWRDTLKKGQWTIHYKGKTYYYCPECSAKGRPYNPEW